MPVLTVATGPNLPIQDRIDDAHRHSLYDARYEYSTKGIGPAILAKASYSAYPARQQEVDGRTVVIEGNIYNRSEDSINAEISDQFSGKINSNEISNWVRDLDGEFVFYAIDRENGDVAIVPDYLGQLPLFHVATEEFAAVSRDKITLAKMAQTTDVDQIAVAEYLRLGYTLSNRTIYEDVQRIPPSTIIRINGSTGQSEMTTHNKFDFSTTCYASRSLKVNAQKLAERFQSACERRAKSCPGENVLLLSGGLDSRSILAAFSNADIQYQAFTRDNEHDSQADVSLSSELADVANATWTNIPTNSPNGDDLINHLTMGGGADTFQIAHIQPFLPKVRSRVAKSSWLYTGDGGDKLFPDLSPVQEISSMSELIDYVLMTESTFDAEVVEVITGVPESRLRDELRETLEAYPEDDFDSMFLHYEVFERAFSWLYEATDTDRYYLWTTTPYYAPDVFKYAMEVPNQQKRHYRLFAEILEILSPEIAGIDNENFGAPPNSYSHAARVAGYNWLQRHPNLLEIVKPLIKSILGHSGGSEVKDSVLKCIQKQAAADKQEVLNVDALDDKVLTDSARFTRKEVLHLLTLTSFLDLHNEDMVLEQYRTETF